MPAALQCPDCGHQEMLDNLGGAATFRCGGCGRALKVPAQFRSNPEERGAPPGSPGARPPSPSDRTQAMPIVPTPRPTPTPTPAPAPASAPVPGPPMVAAGPPLVGSGGTAGGDAALPPGSDLPPLREPPLLTPEALHPPLILRLVLWVIALPLGSLIVFIVASWLKVLTKGQLEDTFLLAGWGRFLPIARLLPFCALVTAALVQLGVLLLERRRANHLRAVATREPGTGRGGRGRGGRGPGPRKPLRPAGPAQRATNGDRSRDRVIS